MAFFPADKKNNHLYQIPVFHPMGETELVKTVMNSVTTHPTLYLFGQTNGKMIAMENPLTIIFNMWRYLPIETNNNVDPI